MPLMNNMTKLLSKIERRLGTKPLNLPDDISKDKWAEEVICNETLDTFSRYFPFKITYLLTPDKRKGDVWLLDEQLCESQVILGGGDIDWHKFSNCAPGCGMFGGIYTPMDMLTSNFDVEDIVMQQQMADHASMFKTGIYLDYEAPNKLRINTVVSNNNLNVLRNIPINLYVRHAPNLMTIEPTKMEIFEQLAQSDVAIFLYEYLKHYDNIETVFANTDLKVSDLQDKANKREEIVQKLEESFVSAANKTMPLMMTI